MFKNTFFIALFILFTVNLQAQIFTDETPFYAETKQVNQFFRRFNGEEDEKGNRYWEKDAQYRNRDLRRKYISILFNNQNFSIPSDQKTKFLEEMTDVKKPVFLSFLGGDWFAEVETEFAYKGKKTIINLYMQLEVTGNQGSKWVINRVHWYDQEKQFYPDSTGKHLFLHPLSHELDFMNLKKVLLDQPEYVEYFTEKNARVDFLSIFLYEIKLGNLKFETVTNLKFHVFQLNNWYFELSNFNRKGLNTGWLISNLSPLKAGEKEKMSKFIQHDKRQ
ncbi:MAG: hypothetical protein EAZ97_16240 [Bacteroidetes bacterium]|nr:MAG: hypothetical protein EAZ97_16240 [Bacteroidota bacterium]